MQAFQKAMSRKKRTTMHAERFANRFNEFVDANLPNPKKVNENIVKTLNGDYQTGNTFNFRFRNEKTPQPHYSKQ